MDIQRTLEKLNEIEREKAQLELLSKQLAEQKADLKKRMDEAGVTPENIDEKITEIEARIAESLKIVKQGASQKEVSPLDSLTI